MPTRKWLETPKTAPPASTGPAPGVPAPDTAEQRAGWASATGPTPDPRTTPAPPVGVPLSGYLEAQLPPAAAATEATPEEAG